MRRRKMRDCKETRLWRISAVCMQHPLLSNSKTVVSCDRSWRSNLSIRIYSSTLLLTVEAGKPRGVSTRARGFSRIKSTYFTKPGKLVRRVNRFYSSYVILVLSGYHIFFFNSWVQFRESLKISCVAPLTGGSEIFFLSFWGKFIFVPSTFSCFTFKHAVPTFFFLKELSLLPL